MHDIQDKVVGSPAEEIQETLLLCCGERLLQCLPGPAQPAVLLGCLTGRLIACSSFAQRGSLAGSRVRRQ